MADYAGTGARPSKVKTFARRLLDLLDQDGGDTGTTSSNADLAPFALDHNDLTTSGEEAPHLNVTVSLAELEDRARGALIDFGGRLTPPEPRMFACDADVIPIVVGGQGHGTTSINNLVMLCRRHHRLFRIRDGTPEFIPPQWLDKTQTPRRKRTVVLSLAN